MPDKSVINYNEIYTLLRSVICDREFAALLEIQDLFKNYFENPDAENDVDFQRVQLAVYYIYYNMLTEEERNIFPFLKEAILKMNMDVISYYSLDRAKDILKNEYQKENCDLEQKYIFCLAMNAFNQYDYKTGLAQIDEYIDMSKMRIFLEMLYTTKYSRFNNISLQGLYLWRGIGNFDNFSKYELDLIDIVLRRTSLILTDVNHINEEDVETTNPNQRIDDEIDDMNFLD